MRLEKGVKNLSTPEINDLHTTLPIRFLEGGEVL